jgi:hypothetical protein
VVHDADGVVEADVLEEQRDLVDALEIAESREAEATEFFAAKDYGAAGGAAEAHLWEEGVHRVFLDLVKVVLAERPTC